MPFRDKASVDPAIKDLQATPKLVFPEKIDPSDERNDLYITLKGPNGEFAQDRKKAAKNVQVRVNVLLDTVRK